MRIIALAGSDSCGKTTTLNIVYARILNNGGNSTNRQQLGADPNDFSDIVNLGARRVAFFTMGDYSRATVNAIRSYHALRVDILVCACNTKFTYPLNEVRKHTNNIVNKSVANATLSELGANTNDANTIFALI